MIQNRYDQIAKKIAENRGGEYPSRKSVTIETPQEVIEVALNVHDFSGAIRNLRGYRKRRYIAVPNEIVKQALERMQHLKIGVMNEEGRIQPKKRPRKYIYGKFYHDTLEFHYALHDLFSAFFEDHRGLNMRTHNDIIELRNRVCALLNSWIGAKKFETKFGIKLPLHSIPPSIKNFIERQAHSYHRIYKPCEICGESRITHDCHIIPYSEGGPSDEKNYIVLCPTHHHLFDDNRLNEKEWQEINFSDKLEASQQYIKSVKMPMLERFWATIKCEP